MKKAILYALIVTELLLFVTESIAEIVATDNIKSVYLSENIYLTTVGSGNTYEEEPKNKTIVLFDSTQAQRSISIPDNAITADNVLGKGFYVLSEDIFSGYNSPHMLPSTTVFAINAANSLEIVDQVFFDGVISEKEYPLYVMGFGSAENIGTVYYLLEIVAKGDELLYQLSYLSFPKDSSYSKLSVYQMDNKNRIIIGRNVCFSSCGYAALAMSELGEAYIIITNGNCNYRIAIGKNNSVANMCWISNTSLCFTEVDNNGIAIINNVYFTDNNDIVKETVYTLEDCLRMYSLAYNASDHCLAFLYQDRTTYSFHIRIIGIDGTEIADCSVYNGEENDSLYPFGITHSGDYYYLCDEIVWPTLSWAPSLSSTISSTIGLGIH